jgi:HSP20 family molecular chaperone IbpA
MQKKLKGIHDITTSLHHKKAIVIPPRVWAFSTKPRFRRYEKQVEKSLFVERIEEPKTDVLERMDNVAILAELPGMKKEDIQWEINGDIFSIHAHDRSGLRKYSKEILLPFLVEETHIKTEYRNGIFEICFRRKKRTQK